VAVIDNALVHPVTNRVGGGLELATAPRACVPDEAQNFTGTLEVWWTLDPDVVATQVEEAKATATFGSSYTNQTFSATGCGIIDNFTDHLGREWRVRTACDIAGGMDRLVMAVVVSNAIVAELVADPDMRPLVIGGMARISMQSAENLVENPIYTATRFFVRDGAFFGDWDSGRNSPHRFSVDIEDGMPSLPSSYRQVSPDSRIGPRQSSAGLTEQCEVARENGDYLLALYETDADTVSDRAPFEVLEQLRDRWLHHRHDRSQDTHALKNVKAECESILSESPHPALVTELRWHDRILDRDDTFASSTAGFKDWVE